VNVPAVTIVLCTWNRPDMLRDALQSIRDQTARDAIARVLVSENSLNGQSENVCAEFPDLPILYVQQRPPVPTLLHVRAIWHLVQTPLAAILHDDDWWMATHLRSALDALESNQRCVAVYSSFLESFGPKGTAWLNQCYYLAWLATGGETARPTVFLDPPATMLGCVVNAGFHYSTVVGRSPAMWDAFSRNISRGNSFDNDRTFPVFLSQHGSVGYVTTPSVFVRSHLGREAWSAEHLQRGHMKMAQETTHFLLASFPTEVSAAAARFRSFARTLESSSSEVLWRVVKDGTFEPQWSTLVNECGIELSALRPGRTQTGMPHWAMDSFNAFCPPLVNRWLHIKLWERLMLRKKRREGETSKETS
jgi:hypothetical protein